LAQAAQRWSEAALKCCRIGRTRLMRTCILLLLVAASATESHGKKHHKHHHHKHHHHHTHNSTAAANASAASAGSATDVNATETEIMDKMKALEQKMNATDVAEASSGVKQGRIIVNGPLPTDFSTVFADAVAASTGCDAKVVKIIETHAVASSPASFLQVSMKGATVEVVFEAPADIVDSVESQAADPESKLVNGALHDYLVADDSSGEDAEPTAAAAAPMEIDTEMPYGELEPFGREDTAQELTDQSIQESDEMVDQLERAEVAEEKRAVFRALTRLRGAAITSFDGIARSQTGNIDEYNHLHKWRETHPLHHLADEESDVSKWAFPDNAD